MILRQPRPMVEDHTRLLALAQTARTFMEPVWRLWHEAGDTPPHVPSTGVCGRTSHFLARLLTQEGIPARPVLGAPGEAGYGFHTPEGWRGHFWVETATAILDITADQFGAAPVIVTRRDDPRYRAGGWDTADTDHIAARHKTADALMALWGKGHGTRHPLEQETQG